MKVILGAFLAFWLFYSIFGYYENKSKRDIAEKYREHEIYMEKVNKEIKEF